MNAMEWLKNLFSGKKMDTRVLVDLIFQASSFYALPVPSAKVDIGDYGFIDTKTGVFRKKGNLLEDFDDLELWLGKPHTTKEDRREFTARQTETRKQHGGVAANVVPLAGVKLEQGAEYEISSSRSAVLYLMQPAHSAYPVEGRLGDFLMWKTKDDPKKRTFYLKQVVVTKTYKSQSYAQFVSNGQTGKVKCEFKCKVPTPPANVALSSDQVWETTSQSGTWSLGGYTKDQYSFTPLVELQSLEKKSDCPFVRPFEYTKDLEFEAVYKQVRPSADEAGPNLSEEGKESYNDFAKDAIALKTSAIAPAANASKPAAPTSNNSRPDQGKVSLSFKAPLQIPINIGGGQDGMEGGEAPDVNDDGEQQEPGVASDPEDADTDAPIIPDAGVQEDPAASQFSQGDGDGVLPNTQSEPSSQQIDAQPCPDDQDPDCVPAQSSTTPSGPNCDGDCTNQSPPDDDGGQAPSTEQSCPAEQITGNVTTQPSTSPASPGECADDGANDPLPDDGGEQICIPIPPADADGCEVLQNDSSLAGFSGEETCEEECPPVAQVNSW